AMFTHSAGTSASAGSGTSIDAVPTTPPAAHSAASASHGSARPSVRAAAAGVPWMADIAPPSVRPPRPSLDAVGRPARRRRAASGVADRVARRREALTHLGGVLRAARLERELDAGLAHVELHRVADVLDGDQVDLHRGDQ